MRKPNPIFTARNTKTLLFVFLCCPGVRCGEAFCGQLGFRFRQGDKYFLLFNSSQRTEQEVNDQPYVTEQAVRFGCDLEITEVEENGAAWAKYTYRQVAMKSSDSSGKNEFDSEVDVNRPRIPLQVLPLYVALNEELYIKITPYGSIARINGLQAIITAAQNKVLVSVARRSMGTAFEVIDATFSEAEVRKILEDHLAVFPPSGVLRTDPCAYPAANDIAVGEPNQWTRIENIEDSDMVMESVFRLAEVRSDGNAVIDVNLVIKTSDNVKEVISSGIKTRREVGGRGRGQIEIDKSTGQIINKRLVYDWVDEIKAVSQGQIRRIPPVPKPIHTHVETTFQMIKRDSAKQAPLPEPNKP